jgi:glycosyltransferase involved in cell wall biosynthesis
MTSVVFDNFGPYLWARVNASGIKMPVLAVELYGRSAEYAWERCVEAETVRFVTLLPEADSRAATASVTKRRLEAVFSEYSPDVVAIPGWSFRGALVVLQWCLKHRVPAAVMSESTKWDAPRVAWKEAVKRRIAALFSAALVGGTPHKDYMVKLGMPAERVFLGYDAVDNGYFERAAKEVRSQKPEVRRKFGLPEHYFLASARFIEKKNLPRLLEAYARYRNLAAKAENRNQKVENKNEFQLSAFPISAFKNVWDLVLLGDGPLKSDLCRLISDLRLQHSVHLPGFKQYDELPAYYGLAGAFIHASTTEQWGLVVNEAMACGLPVLVSNRCGCAADLVQECVNGFTFDPFDVEEMAQAMFQLSACQIVRLSEMGAASARLISGWGLERFAVGLKDAADCALKVGPKRAGMFDRLLLWALVHRNNA